MSKSKSKKRKKIRTVAPRIRAYLAAYLGVHLMYRGQVELFHFQIGRIETLMFAPGSGLRFTNSRPLPAYELPMPEESARQAQAFYAELSEFVPTDVAYDLDADVLQYTRLEWDTHAVLEAGPAVVDAYLLSPAGWTVSNAAELRDRWDDFVCRSGLAEVNDESVPLAQPTDKDNAAESQHLLRQDTWGVVNTSYACRARVYRTASGAEYMQLQLLPRERRAHELDLCVSGVVLTFSTGRELSTRFRLDDANIFTARFDFSAERPYTDLLAVHLHAGIGTGGQRWEHSWPVVVPEISPPRPTPMIAPAEPNAQNVSASRDPDFGKILASDIPAALDASVPPEQQILAEHRWRLAGTQHDCRVRLVQENHKYLAEIYLHVTQLTPDIDDISVMIRLHDSYTATYRCPDCRRIPDRVVVALPATFPVSGVERVNVFIGNTHGGRTWVQPWPQPKAD